MRKRPKPKEPTGPLSIRFYNARPIAQGGQNIAKLFMRLRRPNYNPSTTTQPFRRNRTSGPEINSKLINERPPARAPPRGRPRPIPPL